MTEQADQVDVARGRSPNTRIPHKFGRESRILNNEQSDVGFTVIVCIIGKNRLMAAQPSVGLTERGVVAGDNRGDLLVAAGAPINLVWG